MSLFIGIQVAPELADDRDLAGRLAEICPVDIFARGPDGRIQIADANVDECTLCELCLATAAPGGIRIVKRYARDEVLVRRA